MSRFSEADIEDIKARNSIVDIAGGYVKLRRSGAKMVGPCPMCGGGETSQRFEVRDSGQSWVCAVCPDGGDVIRLVERIDGCDFLAAVKKLGVIREMDAKESERLRDEREKKRIEREKDSSKYREAERKRLWKIWSSGQDVFGSPVERYLAGRGLLLPSSCPGIRYLTSAPYWHGESVDRNGRRSPVAIHNGPAMLAAFIRADGHFGGLHMTYLDCASTPAKIELHDPESGELLNAKKMRGSKTGAHIAVATTQLPPRRLVIGEGIETVLAVLTAYRQADRIIDDMAFWAAGDLGNLAGRARENLPHPELKQPSGRPQRVPGPQPDSDDSGLAIPDSVEELILLGDGDSEPVLTRWAMMRAARRYARHGRAVRIAFAKAGFDFNDMLRVTP